ncbi:MAG TPA: sugar phosphate nucleotidyltransferase [Gemmatimonadaceae bacterium]|nr:sugar phosphate nucleotidyltransferase [Gemmatimonadaceae bacterium]
MTLWAVVLAGGVGSRFWPLSTPQRPKQLLPLVDDTPLLLGTLRRLRALVPTERTLVLTNKSLVAPIAELASELPRNNLIAEPRPAGTAAALAWAAREIERRDGPTAVMICVHADWSIGNVPGFLDALRRAADAAEARQGLVTVGIVPTRPDPGFGYIQPADGGGPNDVRRVARFVEKPDRTRAEQMVREGYLWNSGIFVWRVGDFLDEIRARTPEVAPALESSGDDAERFFSVVKPISVDVGVLERSDRVYVLGGDFGWDDVGTWAALRRVRSGDAAGNAASGSYFGLDSQRNVVHADGGGSVVLYGVSDLVVVSRNGMTLVTTVERAADLKTLIEALPAEMRDRP